MGHIYLYYGDGGGKTTSALGLALRSVGHKHRVAVIQFMKWFKETGEYKIQPMLSPYYSIHQFGEPGWIKLGEKSHEKVEEEIQTRKSDEKDRIAAKKALEFARGTLETETPKLLILDEVCLAVHYGILSLKDVLDLLEEVPKNTDVVMTGRYAPKEMIERADFVNKIVSEKAPEKFVNKEGIQF